MHAIAAVVIGLVLLLVPWYGIPKIYGRYRPNATVGDVGPWIILAFLVEIVILFALLAYGSGG